LRGVGVTGQDFTDAHLAGVGIKKHQVGEGAADVNRQGERFMGHAFWSVGSVAIIQYLVKLGHYIVRGRVPKTGCIKIIKCA